MGNIQELQEEKFYPIGTVVHFINFGRDVYAKVKEARQCEGCVLKDDGQCFLDMKCQFFERSDGKQIAFVKCDENGGLL